MDLLALSGPYVLILSLVLLAGGLAFLLRRFRDTPVSSVHPVRKPITPDEHGHTCKFDPHEERRTRHQLRPGISLQGLASADPGVAAILAAVDVNHVKTRLLEYTGEVEAEGVRLVTRNSHHGDFGKAIHKVVNFYKGLGFGDQTKLPGSSVKVLEYTKSRKKYLYVVAELPGEDMTKVLIFGSHLDSTAGSPWKVENMAPGADDDASGTVGVEETAKAMLKVQRGMRIRFCHFSGEEQGLWASTVYSDVVAAENLNVVAMIQMDMIGYCRPDNNNRVDVHDNRDQNGSHSIVAAMTRAAAQYKLKLTVVDTHNKAVEGRSDHAPFLDHGWKAVLVSEEFTDEGFNPNYHSLKDRVPTLNLPWMVEVIRMVIAAGIELSESK